ncbi:MAG: hypothetical protein HFH93_13710 [Lachnospiraceae bacterium]|nr:hypothetical protein [Lachnospiraceae bacterium]
MAVKLLEIKRESWPAVRLIGKKYSDAPNWGEWWEKDWFEILEAKQCTPMNGDAYVGAVHIVDGRPERWIGMFFPADTSVPEGFEFVDIEPLDYGVCYLSGREGEGEFFTMDTHNMCLEALRAEGFVRKEDDWCFDRYNCPRYTTPDGEGNVILDYGISVMSVSGD